MFYLIQTLSDLHPEFLKFINGKLIEQNEHFEKLLDTVGDLVTKNERLQAITSISNIGTYYSVNCKYTIVDERDLKFIYPNLFANLNS